MRAFQRSVEAHGSVGRRMALALSLAPVAAALAGMVAGEIFQWAYTRGPYPERSASYLLLEFLYALLFGSFVALVFEIVVAWPFFLLFRRLGWLNLAGFLAGAAIIAALLEALINDQDAPRWAGMALCLLPSLAGALTFGYVGGWLRSPRYLRDILPPS